MDLKLKGKLALVTGSTAGIGLAIATALAREGARVIVNGRSKASVDEVVASLKSDTGADLYGFAADMSSASSAEQLLREYPGVQILINNLAIFEPKPFEEIPDADWMRLFEGNVLSGVRLARLVLPSMRRANWGRIIFISSESAVQIPSEMIHYGVTKTALLGVSRGLAEALAGSAITVNCILPGHVYTPMGDQGGEDVREQRRRAGLLSLEGLAWDIAWPAVFLASEESRWITGVELPVDAGTTSSAAWAIQMLNERP